MCQEQASISEFWRRNMSRVDISKVNFLFYTDFNAGISTFSGYLWKIQQRICSAQQWWSCEDLLSLVLHKIQSAASERYHPRQTSSYIPPPTSYRVTSWYNNPTMARKLPKEEELTLSKWVDRLVSTVFGLLLQTFHALRRMSMFLGIYTYFTWG